MEAPNLNLKLKEDELFKKPKDIKTLSFKIDQNNEFEIEYYLFEDKIYFEGKEKNKISQKNYRKIYSFDDIIQKNKFFQCVKI